MKKVLVVAPHHDDEVLGVGGTIAKLSSQGCEVFVCIVTKGREPHYSGEEIEITRVETKIAHDLLGVTKTVYLDLPAAELDQVPEKDIGASISSLVKQIEPEAVFIPFSGDIHFDHQKVALASLVACRPHVGFYPKNIFAYETLSETNWNAPYLVENFTPNIYVDISEFIDLKLKAIECFESQVFDFPHERSLKSIDALAKHRGCTVRKKAAEAFVAIRQVDIF
jgi:LmbE family N-acetylglucosaminyl deacetylase